MADFTLAAFGTIAAVLFVTELTDKDAFLLIAVSSKVRWRVAFMAGATAFTFNTLLIVLASSVIVAIVPVHWVRLAGGVVMLAYGLWEAKGLVGKKAVEEEETRIQKARSTWGAFFALVAALSLLDLAGDATEVLTIVFVAQYSNPYLVFSGVIAGLLTATALETALGNRLGRILTPDRIRYLSMVVFIALGAFILLLYS